MASRQRFFLSRLTSRAVHLRLGQAGQFAFGVNPRDPEDILEDAVTQTGYALFRGEKSFGGELPCVLIDQAVKNRPIELSG